MRKMLVFLICGLLPPSAWADSAEEKGLAIAVAADERDAGFGDFTADMIMTLKNRRGEESVRNIRIRTLEVNGDGDKSLSVFDRPRDVKGTAQLTFSHGLEPDDQWLYLPALKRVKRINSKNKSGPFMGSEFAFEDLGSQEVEKYKYKYLREEACGDGWECHVMERYPQYEHSGYTRQIVWIDKAEYRAVKAQFYDRKDALLKTLEWSGYQEYIGRYWRADEMFMQNHQNGKSTLLQWSSYTFKTGLSDKDFNANTLARVR
ncbi:MAG: outer membrane lipoprotein-sorting protein [Gammaproteobacteria bacterium]